MTQENPFNTNFQTPTNSEITNNEGLNQEEELSNIQQSVLDELKDIVHSNQIPMWIRPVNKIALAHMKRGAVGKTMFIHGKSSPPGTIAQGLISMRSCISKAGKDDDIEKIKQYNDENAHSIQTSDEQFAKIEERLRETVQKRHDDNLDELEGKDLFDAADVTEEELAPLLQELNLLDKNGNQIYVFENENGLALRDNEGKYRYGIKAEGGFILIDLDHEIIPPGDVFNPPEAFTPVAIKILGKLNVTAGKDGALIKESSYPYTADIDLLGISSQHIDLNRYDQVRANQNYVRREKLKAIKDRHLNLSKQQIEELLETNELKDNNNIDETRLYELSNELKKIDKLRENYKSIGHGTDDFIALVGHMRSAFSDKTELSHGAEQFNIDFTQPQDTEWVHIDIDGNVSILKGEEELLESFNRYIKKGYSNPPNPFWGWQWNEDRNGYEIDPNRVNTDAIRTARSSATKEQKKLIDKILKTQCDLGIAKISGESNVSKYKVTSRRTYPVKTMQLQSKFDSLIKKYNDSYHDESTIEIPGNPFKQTQNNQTKNGKKAINQNRKFKNYNPKLGKRLQKIRSALEENGLKTSPLNSTTQNKKVAKGKIHSR